MAFQPWKWEPMDTEARESIDMMGIDDLNGRKVGKNQALSAGSCQHWKCSIDSQKGGNVVFWIHCHATAVTPKMSLWQVKESELGKNKETPVAMQTLKEFHQKIFKWPMEHNSCPVEIMGNHKQDFVKRVGMMMHFPGFRNFHDS